MYNRIFRSAVERVGFPPLGSDWHIGQGEVIAWIDNELAIALLRDSESAAPRIELRGHNRREDASQSEGWDVVEHAYALFVAEVAGDKEIVAAIGALKDRSPAMSEERLQVLLVKRCDTP